MNRGNGALRGGWSLYTLHVSADGKTLTVSFRSDAAFPQLPLLWWNRPEIQAQRKTRTASIIVADISIGEDRIAIQRDPF